MALGTDDVVAGYSYSVEIDQVEIAQFNEFSGATLEIQVIEHRANNPRGLPIIKKAPGALKAGDLTLKKGKTESRALHDWITQVERGQIDQARKNGSVVIYDYSRNEVARYNFINGWPSKWALGALKSGANEVLHEDITITHEGLTQA
jgi:phage tail-like protein